MQQTLLTDQHDRWLRGWFLIGGSCKYSRRWRRKCTCELLNLQSALASAFQPDKPTPMLCLLQFLARNMQLTYMIYLHSLLHNWAGLGSNVFLSPSFCVTSEQFIFQFVAKPGWTAVCRVKHKWAATTVGCHCVSEAAKWFTNILLAYKNIYKWLLSTKLFCPSTVSKQRLLLDRALIMCRVCLVLKDGGGC